MIDLSKSSCIFEQKDLIGKGSFSKVYKSNKFNDGSTQTSAVKVYQKTKQNHQVISHAKREQSMLQNIQSDYICSYRQSIQSKDRYYMIQKLQKGITLDLLIQKHKKIEPKEVIKISKEILKGIQYLYLKKIMHRDLKPSNIIYNPETNKTVLLDLGFAAYFHKNDQKIFTYIVGTPNYMSPEILMRKKYNSLSDIWSFGVIVYQMLCGQVPFKGRNQKQILNSILSKNIAFKYCYSPTLEWIIRNCLKIETKQRMKWQDLFEWMKTGQFSINRNKQYGFRQKNKNHSKNLKSLQKPIYLEKYQSKQNNCQCQLY